MFNRHKGYMTHPLIISLVQNKSPDSQELSSVVFHETIPIEHEQCCALWVSWEAKMRTPLAESRASVAIV